MSDNMILDGQGPGEATKTTNGKSRKMRAGFATLAVLGLGAGLTTAAFSGNVEFVGSVKTAPAHLEARVHDGSQDGGEWVPIIAGEAKAIGEITVSPSGDAEVDWNYAEKLLQVRGADGYVLDTDAIVTATLEGGVVDQSGRMTLDNNAQLWLQGEAAVGADGIASEFLFVHLPSGTPIDNQGLSNSFTVTVSVDDN